MRSKLVIAAFILSILALAAGGASLWLNLAAAGGDTGDAQPANTPPANSGKVTLIWSILYNSEDYKIEYGDVYLTDTDGKQINVGTKKKFNPRDPFRYNDYISKDGSTYDSFSFEIADSIEVKSISIGGLKSSNNGQGILLMPGYTYEIFPDSSIIPRNFQ